MTGMQGDRTARPRETPGKSLHWTSRDLAGHSLDKEEAACRKDQSTTGCPGSQESAVSIETPQPPATTTVRAFTWRLEGHATPHLHRARSTRVQNRPAKTHHHWGGRQRVGRQSILVRRWKLRTHCPRLPHPTRKAHCAPRSALTLTPRKGSQTVHQSQRPNKEVEVPHVEAAHTPNASTCPPPAPQFASALPPPRPPCNRGPAGLRAPPAASSAPSRPARGSP